MIRFIGDRAHFEGMGIVRGSPPPLEERLAAAVAAMRATVIDFDDDDFHRNRARILLDRRPLVVVAIAFDGQTTMWAMEPGIDEGRDGTIEAIVSHWRDADGGSVHAPRVDLGRKVRLMQQMEEAIDWLVWEDSGQRLAELVGREPDSGPR